ERLLQAGEALLSGPGPRAGPPRPAQGLRRRLPVPQPADGAHRARALQRGPGVAAPGGALRPTASARRGRAADADPGPAAADGASPHGGAAEPDPAAPSDDAAAAGVAADPQSKALAAGAHAAVADVAPGQLVQLPGARVRRLRASRRPGRGHHPG